MTSSLDVSGSPSKMAPGGSSDIKSRLDSATNELRLLRSEVSQDGPRFSGLASQVSDVTRNISAEYDRSLVDLKASLQEQKHRVETLGIHLSRLAMQTSKRMNSLEEARQENFRQLASRLDALEAQDGLEALAARLLPLEAKSCCPLERVQELEARVSVLTEDLRFERSRLLDSDAQIDAAAHKALLNDQAAAQVVEKTKMNLEHSESLPLPMFRRSVTWDPQVGNGATPSEALTMHEWSKDQTHVLCAAGEEATIDGKAPRLDQFSSVSEAIEQLNSNCELCPDGVCTVFSSSQGSYVLLFRSDKRREALATFGLDDHESISSHPGVSPEKPPIGSPSSKGSGGLFKSLIVRLNSIVSDTFVAKPAAHFNPSQLVMTHAANLGDRYEILRQLGAGAQGTTHLVRRNITGVEYVAKETNNNGADNDASEDLLMEFRKMQELRHPNCVKVIELLQGKQGKAFVILEYARGGDLYKYMQVALEHHGLTETLIAGVFKQAMQGVAYLHTQDCVHNDLKPDNLLCLDEYDPKKVPRCVVSDYGCARFIKTEQRFKFGDPRYQSLENMESMLAFLKAEDFLQVDTRPKGDVWSMGATLYELLSGGVIPFLYDRCSLQGLQDDGVFDRLQAGILSKDEVVLRPHCSDVSEAAEGVLRMMLRKDEDARPTAQAVLSDPWFKTKTRRRISAAIARHVEFTVVKDQARQILLNAVIARLQNDHMQTSQDIFKRFDTDNLGKITREGFKKALERMNQDTSRADEIFDAADVTGDGTLEFNEFAAMTFDWSSIDAQALDSHIQDLLNDLSTDGRGTVKESELAKLFGDSVQAGELRSLFKEIDSQNAGQLSKTEVRAFLQQQKKTVPALSLDMTVGSFYDGAVGTSFA